MKRVEFIATIGFQGGAAIVDKNLLREIKNLTTRELADKGYFRAAFCSAVYSSQADQDSSEEQYVLDCYNRSTANKLSGTEGLRRLFGVYQVPGDINKVTYV